MSDWDSSGYDNAEAYDSGPVQLEFVDPPSLNGEHVEWTFRTVGRRTAPAGTQAAHIMVVLTHNNEMKGVGNTTLGSELGPHDIGAGRFNPLQYIHEDGDYYVSVTIGGDVKYVSFRVHDRQMHAA